MSEQTRLEQLEEQIKGMGQVQPLDMPPDNQEEQVNEAPPTDPQPAPVETQPPSEAKQETPPAEPPKPPEQKPDDILETEIKGTPQAEHFHKLRDVTKNFKQENARLKQELEEIKSKLVLTPKQEPAPASEPAKALTTDEVIGFVAKARNKEYGSGRDEAVIREARAILEKTSPKELREVMAKARSGAYGQYSEDVQLYLSEVVPEVLVARQAEIEETVEETRERQRLESEYRSKSTESMSRLTDKHPELKDEKSELRLFVNKFLEEKVGLVDENGTPKKQGPWFDMLRDPLWPEKVIPEAIERFTLQKTRVVSAPSPEASGSRGAPVPGAGGKTRLEQLESQLRSMGQVATLNP